MSGWRLALLLRKPAFPSKRDNPVLDHWSALPQACVPLAPLLRRTGLRLVGPGRLHGRLELGAVPFAPAPPISFVVHPREREVLPGERVCGALVRRARADRAEPVPLVPEGMETSFLDDVRTHPHPREPEPERR